MVNYYNGRGMEATVAEMAGADRYTTPYTFAPTQEDNFNMTTWQRTLAEDSYYLLGVACSAECLDLYLKC